MVRADHHGSSRDVERVSHRFPKRLRLRKRSEFLFVQRSGHKVHGRHFLVIAAARRGGEDGPGRVGITVSKKVGNAVTRNRLKRLVREHVRTTPGFVPRGVDVVVIAKRSAARIRTQPEVAAELDRTRSRLARC